MQIEEGVAAVAVSLDLSRYGWRFTVLSKELCFWRCIVDISARCYLDKVVDPPAFCENDKCAMNIRKEVPRWHGNSKAKPGALCDLEVR